ncbi:MAG: hypothetical protein ACI92E_002435, partial [Oceanicoccus sp.]
QYALHSSQPLPVSQTSKNCLAFSIASLISISPC